jgi:hypothetical protein
MTALRAAPRGAGWLAKLQMALQADSIMLLFFRLSAAAAQALEVAAASMVAADCWVAGTLISASFFPNQRDDADQQARNLKDNCVCLFRACGSKVVVQGKGHAPSKLRGPGHESSKSPSTWHPGYWQSTL